jgi:hypothetical protein
VFDQYHGALYKSLLTKHSKFGNYTSEILSKRDNGLIEANIAYKQRALNQVFAFFQSNPEIFERVYDDDEPMLESDQPFIHNFGLVRA